jgi:Domain of unknown function (DUF4326)
MIPKRVQLSRKRGWRMPPNTIKVDRSTQWGNPFRIGPGPEDAASPSHAVFKFKCMTTRGISGAQYRGKVQHLLKGKNLACWCPLDAPCHADVLLEIANSP